MASEFRSDLLGPVDSAFFYVDTPKTPMNLGAVTIFDGEIPFDDLFQFIDSRIYQAPIYLKRIVQAPLSMSEPRWVLDPGFQTSRHVFQHKLDAPGTDEQLREFAGHLVSGMLERDRPLWQIHLISGLEDNRTALLFKIHHCMVDGLSAVELFTLLLDLTPDPNPSAPQKVFYIPPPIPNALELVAGNVSKEIPYRLSILQKLGSQALKIGAILADREERRKTFVGVANLINDNLYPIRKLLINGTNTGRMTLAWTEYPLDEIQTMRTVHHASINEIMLAVLGIGLGMYLEKAGEKSRQDFVRVLAPVNVRAEEEKGAFGNRIAVLPIDVPLYLDDPLKCLERVVHYSQTMKQSQLSQGVDMLLTLPSLATDFAQPLIWGIAPAVFAFLAHTWCTNVAGPKAPIYLMGHKMLNTYGYFPLNASMGLASVIMSYNEKISMTVIADAGIIPDVQEIQRCLDRAYLALRAATHIDGHESVNGEASQNLSTPVTQEPHDQGLESIPVVPPTPPTVKDDGHTGAGPEPQPAQVETVLTADASTYLNLDAVPVHQPAVPTSKDNGHVSTVREPLPQARPAPIEAVLAAVKPQRFRIFTEPWAAAYQESINSSSAYQEASTRWEAGPLAFVMHASPEHNFSQDSAVLLDLHRGHCRSACALPPHEAKARAKFVLEGTYDNWIKALTGQAPPIAMIIRNKLSLTKGSMFSLLPFTQSAEELVHCAQKVSEG